MQAEDSPPYFRCMTTSKPNSRFAELQEVLDDHLFEAWQGDCWRFQTISYPSGREILGGLGAFTHGGRWNAPGIFPVVYGSTTEEVALLESKAHDHYFRIVTRNARIFVCIGFKLSRVLDLTRVGTLARLGLAAADLLAEDWRKIQASGYESLTQCVGRATFDAGVEGLVTASGAVENGKNVAYFPDNFAFGSSVILHDEAALQGMQKFK